MTLRSLPHSLGRCALLSALLAFGGAVAHAETQPPTSAPAASTVWQCEYHYGTTIYCRVDIAPARAEPAAMNNTATAAPQDDGDVHALPRLVTMIHETPSELVNRRIAIPMFSPTRNVALAHELADAVVCNAQAACRVEFVARNLTVRDAFASR